MYRRFGKRVFDTAAAGVLLFLLAPVLALIALAVVCALGRPVFYKQIRPGRDGALFSIVKFRTMREAANERGEPLPDEARLGRFGALLRSTSLDELPELWNVLRGDMSLVGPRPLLPQYVDRYTPRQARRMEVRPGITGWAQINGRNALDWETRFEMDVWYVENVSFVLDLRILVRTVGKILRREGISAEGRATMEEFRGSGPSKPD